MTAMLDACSDPVFLRRALTRANPNAIRMALIEENGDSVLARMRPHPKPVRGGAMEVPVLAREDREIVIEHAVAYLSHPRPFPLLADRGRAAALLDLFGPTFKGADRLLALDDLGLVEEFRLTSSERAGLATLPVTIIGAGISGLALAIRLKAAGVPFRILERQDGIGGTWHLNDYPEARVDISTFIYQFRSERNFPWTCLYAPQEEIRSYLRHIAAKHGLDEHIELGITVERARWLEGSAEWEVDFRRSDGAQGTLRSSVLVSAAGLFSTPNLPDIPGLADFAGDVFHTTTWRHDVDLSGRRVALVGNGSSGVQLMPWLARRAKHLTVFQRSPNWITPVPDYRDEVGPELAWLFEALPAYWHWHCFAMGVLDRQVEALQVEAQDDRGRFNARNEAYRHYLEVYAREQLDGRPDLLAASIPMFPPLARRMVVDSGWYQALRQPNVSLVASPIARFDAFGARTADGAHHLLDAVVLGTGFRAGDFLCTVDYRGEDGLSLAELWRRDGPRAHLGMFLPRFPNLAILYGPNGQPQSGSFHDWADRWARTVIALMSETTRRGARTFRLPDPVYEAYNRELDEAMSVMVWGRGGASGYYVNERGRPITKMPWPAADFFERLTQVPASFAYE